MSTLCGSILISVLHILWKILIYSQISLCIINFSLPITLNHKYTKALCSLHTTLYHDSIVSHSLRTWFHRLVIQWNIKDPMRFKSVMLKITKFSKHNFLTRILWHVYYGSCIGVKSGGKGREPMKNLFLNVFSLFFCIPVPFPLCWSTPNHTSH